MDCQDARAFSAASSSAGVGLTEGALAAAHLAHCPECRRGEWEQVVDPDAPGGPLFNTSAVSAVKTSAWMCGWIRLLRPVRLTGSVGVASFADQIVHVMRRMTPADAVVVRLRILLRIAWRRAGSGAMELLRYANVSATSLCSHFAHSATSLFKRRVIEGATVLGLGRRRVLACMISVGASLQRRFDDARIRTARISHRVVSGLLMASQRMFPRTSLTQWVARHGAGIRHSATIANLVTQVQRLWTATGKFAHRARTALSRRTADVRGISEVNMAASECSAGPSDMEPNRGLFRVLQISSGIVPVSLLSLFSC